MKQVKKSTIARFSRFHRVIGLLACLPMLSLALTGILLNHSEMLKLDSIHITQPQILKWYGMEPKSAPVAIEFAGNWIVAFENLLYVNGKLIDQGASSPTGAGMLDSALAISTQDSLLLIEQNSNTLIEKLGREILPQGKIRSMAVHGGRVLLDTDSGQYSAPPDLSQFIQDDRQPLPVANTSAIPKGLYQAMVEDWRGQGLSLWRLILDFHSASVLGKLGTVIMDVAALCMFGLVISGIYLWSQRLPKHDSQKHLES